jgi:hypothetical protein
MPGETRSLAEKSRHAGVALEVALQLAQRLDLVHERPHLRHLVGVDEVVLEDRELARVLDLVVGAVLLLEEVVDLGGGELVRVAAVDVDHHGVAGLDVARS